MPAEPGRRATMRSPRFKLERVVAGQPTGRPQIVPVTKMPWDANLDRRGFLGAGLTATAAAVGLACAPPNDPRLPAHQDPPPPDDGTNREPRAQSAPTCQTGVAHRDPIVQVAAGDVTSLLSATRGEVKIWAHPGGRLRGSLAGGGAPISTSADGKIVVAPFHATDGIGVWKLPAGARIGLIKTTRLDALAITPDGTACLAITANGGAIYDLKTYAVRGRFDPGTVLAASHDVICVGDGHGVTLFSVSDGSQRGKVDGPAVAALVVTHDSKNVVAGGLDGSLRLISLADAKVTAIGSLGEKITRIATSPDDSTIAIAGERDATLMRLEPGTQERQVLDHESRVLGLAFSATGKRLMTGDSNGHITSWAAPSGVPVKTVAAHFALESMAVSHDGMFLASVGSDRTISLWTMPELEHVGCLMDLNAFGSDTKAVTYNRVDERGARVSWTQPCGSPIPPDAVCTCNCVPGTYTPPDNGAAGSGGGTICTCNTVCTCVPVYY
jgi:WD40 domain-containing protein